MWDRSFHLVSKLYKYTVVFYAHTVVCQYSMSLTL